MFVIFLHCRVNILFPFPYLAPLEGSLCMQPTFMEWGDMLLLFEGKGVYINYLEFLIEICLYSPFIYSMVSLYQYELLDISFILWVTIQYHFIHVVAHIVPAVAIGSSFCWVLCPFDISSSLWGFLKRDSLFSGTRSSRFLLVPAPFLGSVFLPKRSLDSFYCRMILTVKICMFIDTGVCLFLDPTSWQSSKYMWVY